ncbi:MAG TPA: hypothetical protein V6D27_18030, partial [Vampirovibrionales bacterium]
VSFFPRSAINPTHPAPRYQGGDHSLQLKPNESEMKARSRGGRSHRDGPPEEGDRIAGSGLPIDAW